MTTLAAYNNQMIPQKFNIPMKDVNKTIHVKKSRVQTAMVRRDKSAPRSGQVGLKNILGRNMSGVNQLGKS